MMRIQKWPLAVVLAAMVSTLIGCTEGSSLMSSADYKTLDDVPHERLVALSQRSYFFGHQSVGVNIVDGLALVLKEHPEIQIKVEQTEDAAALKPGSFLHSRIGKNREPVTKIRALEQLMDGGMGDAADAAFVKFCYLDAGSSSNLSVDDLFREYTKSIRALQAKYPETRFVHFTIPLRTVPDGLKVKIKSILGRNIPEYLDNIQRSKFNEMLRAEYVGKEPVFDVARLESVAAGSDEAKTFRHDGKLYEALAPENTYDGGHLNDAGKRWLAEQLLIFLAELDYADA
jgi:hypothetical protein